jgi:drug/metabolite transporter (DMT)-like permease
MSILVWLVPALIAFFIYGIGQGLVKKYANDIPPAQYCLFLVFAKAVVNLGFFFFGGEHPPVFAPESRQFLMVGLLAYMLEGAAWILYFESVVLGPITIVGTLSAAYPAFTVIFARIFLAEALEPFQYVGVGLLIVGCIGLSYSPTEPGAEKKNRIWILLASSALIMWGASQTLVKYSYRLPNSSEVSLSLINTMGGALTLGIYGLWRSDWKTVWQRFAPSFAPMGMMAGGDLLVLIASKKGPVSVVTPISGAYPVVTLGFAWIVLKERLTVLQWFCVALVLIGMFLGPGFK